jgi:hypothetical protein
VARRVASLLFAFVSSRASELYDELSSLKALILRVTVAKIVMLSMALDTVPVIGCKKRVHRCGPVIVTFCGVSKRGLTV